jgi:aspartyl-tRNA(Asn)/glutamyl-tRNA(Gln) amidotransferase subunit C
VSGRITPDDVRYVAALARLALTDEEVDRTTGQLDAMLGHFADIDALDLDGVAPTTHAMPITNVFRPDVVGPTLDRAEVLAQAPKSDGTRFAVPSILGEPA